jgi:hypothetical protein
MNAFERGGPAPDRVPNLEAGAAHHPASTLLARHLPDILPRVIAAAALRVRVSIHVRNVTLRVVATQ